MTPSADIAGKAPAGSAPLLGLLLLCSFLWATAYLLMKVLGRRERLFPYVGYPPLPNRVTACDGLLRE